MSIDIHALSGAYAVGAVDDIERAQFERHLAECQECRAEVASLREAAALLPETTAQAAPAGLRDAVLGSIETVRPLPPVVVAAAERGRSTRRRFLALAAAAVALIALGVGGATVVDLAGDDTPPTAAPSQTDRVLQAADAERVTRPLPGGGVATVVRSRSLRQAVIVTEDMPPAPDLHTYELWLQHGDEMLPAGQIAGGTNTVLLEGDAATADGVGITIELAGGEPTEPSDDVVDVIGFEQA